MTQTFEIDKEIQAQLTHIANQHGYSVDDLLRNLLNRRNQGRQYHTALLDNITEAVIATDANLIITTWNHAAEEIYGWTAKEAIGQKIDSLLQTVWDDTSQADAQAYLLKNGYWNGEMQQFARDGRLLTIWASVSWLRDTDGSIIGGVTVNRDITARKLVEQEFEATRKLLQKLAENYPHSYISVINKDFTIGLTSGQEFTKSGLDPNVFVGLTIEEVFGGYGQDVVAVIREQYEKAFQGEEVTFELVVNEQNQLYRVVPLPDEHNQIPQILSVVENITERRQAEALLRASEERHRAYVEHSPVAIFIADERGQYIDVNPAACDMVGYTRSELLSLSTLDLIPPETHEKGLQRLTRLKAQKHIEQEVVLRRKDGTHIDCLLRGVVLSKNRVMGLCTDITHVKQAKELEMESTRLALQLEKEREIVQLRSHLITTISHEFRTPLAIILNAADILINYRDRITEEKKEQKTQGIVEQVMNLTEMLDSISRLSRIQRGFLAYNPAPTDLEDLVQQIINELNGTIGDKHHFNLRSSLQQSYADVDGKLLRHALTNLLSNAIKYSPDGSNIQVIISDANNQLQFIVQDSGIGIAPSDQAELFKPFYRANNVGNIRGTGIGLSIVREIAEQHGGTVSVDSQLGEGSIFTITIPLQGQPSDETARARL